MLDKIMLFMPWSPCSFKQAFRFCPVAISSLLFCHHCWGCRNVAMV